MSTDRESNDGDRNVSTIGTGRRPASGDGDGDGESGDAGGSSDPYFGYAPTSKSSVMGDDILGDDEDDDGMNEDDDDDDDDDENFNYEDPKGKDGLTLKKQVERCCKYIDIGAAVLYGPLFTADVEDYDGSEELQDAVKSMPETHYARVLRREFNAIVIEHHLKWSPLLSIDLHPPTASMSTTTPLSGPNELLSNTTAAKIPKNASSNADPQSIEKAATLNQQPKHIRSASVGGMIISVGEKPRLGRYDFYYADSIVDWAIANGIKKVKGHVLVWHVTTPKLLEDLEPHQVREELRRHIFTVMGHFRGRITTWDVVNEALAPDGTLAENVFLRKLGPSYIEDSFRWAHEADPNAVLLYNDNKVEGYGTKKANGFYELLADLKAKQVPVHGCGLQAHWNAGGTGLNRPPTPRMFKQQLRRLGKLGLTVNISEMDVRVSKLNPPELRDIAQRQIYHDLISAALSEPAVDGIWLWGFTDRHTWVSNFYYDDEPLIFDEYYQRKPAYYGLRDAISTLCPGHVVAGGYKHNAADVPMNSSLSVHQTIPISSDADDNGNTWGHLWMLPDPDVDLLLDDNSNNFGVGGIAGDARPDWERGPPSVQKQNMESQSQSATSRSKDHEVVEGNSTFDDEEENDDKTRPQQLSSQAMGEANSNDVDDLLPAIS